MISFRICLFVCFLFACVFYLIHKKFCLFRNQNLALQYLLVFSSKVNCTEVASSPRTTKTSRTSSMIPGLLIAVITVTIGGASDVLDFYQRMIFPGCIRNAFRKWSVQRIDDLVALEIDWNGTLTALSLNGTSYHDTQPSNQRISRTEWTCIADGAFLSSMTAKNNWSFSRTRSDFARSSARYLRWKFIRFMQVPESDQSDRSTTAQENHSRIGPLSNRSINDSKVKRQSAVKIIERTQ